MKAILVGASGVGLLVAALLFAGTSASLAGGTTVAQDSGSAQVQPSVLASQDISPSYVAAYQHAATLCPGLSWTVLAGIGKVETDQGRDIAVSSAGAEGPMQFLPSTFASVALPGEGDINSIQDAADAAARYLCMNGGGNPVTVSAAIFAYDHLATYVEDVLSWSARYGASSVVNLAQAPMGGVGAAGAVKVTSLTPVMPGAPFPTGGFPFGQCTYWAALNVPVSWNGNASDWWANSPAVRHSATPAIGDIVVYGPGDGYSVFGHVAVVIGVQAAAGFTVSEMDFVAVGLVDERQSNMQDVLGFISG